MLTLSIRMTDKVCICVGGGVVAERRIARLLTEGAQVTVISPAVTETIAAWAGEGRLSWHQQTYEPGCLPAADFVLAMTDSDTVNRACAKEGREKGALVNRADDQSDCDFTMPAEVVSGDLRITAATGTSPRLNRLIRADMESRYGRIGAVLPILNQYRQTVRSLLSTSKEREAFWQTYVTPADLQNILAGRWNLVEEKIKRAISRIGSKP